METDKLIPQIFNKHSKKGDQQLKKEYVSFLKQYQDDPNDFGGKIAKILELISNKQRSLKLLIKYFNSNSVRMTLRKVTSTWVVENIAQNLILYSGTKKATFNLSKIFKFLGAQNLEKIKNKELTKNVLKFCCRNLGKFFLQDKYGLQILNRVLQSHQTQIAEDDKAKIVTKVVGLCFTYFGVIGLESKTRNIEFMRNYLGCLNLLQLLKKQFGAIGSLKKTIKGMIAVEAKDEVYNSLLSVLILNMSLKVEEKGGLIDPRNQVYKQIVKEKSFQMRHFAVKKDSDFNPKKALFQLSQSSGFSTSDSTSVFAKENSGLKDILRMIKVVSSDMISFLMTVKPQIFLKKKNWKLVIPLGFSGKLSKMFLDENLLFPTSWIPIEMINSLAGKRGDLFTARLLDYQNQYFEKEKEKSVVTGAQMFKKQSVSTGDETGSNPEKELFGAETGKVIQRQMINLRNKFLSSLRSKSGADLSLLARFMLERDNQIRDSLLKVISDYINTQPVDIWLQGRVQKKVILSKAQNFKVEVVNSLKTAMKIILLELCLADEEAKVEHLLGSLLNFFEIKNFVRRLKNETQFLIEILLMPLIVYSKVGVSNSLLSLAVRMLVSLMKSDYWTKENLVELVEVLVNHTDPRLTQKRKTIFAELVKSHLFRLDANTVEKIFNDFVGGFAQPKSVLSEKDQSNMSSYNARKDGFEFVIGSLERYQTYLRFDPNQSEKAPTRKERAINRPAYMTEELEEQKMIDQYFGENENNQLVCSYLSKIFKDCVQLQLGEGTCKFLRGKSKEGDLNELFLKSFSVISSENLQFMIQEFGDKDEVILSLLILLSPQDQISFLESVLKAKNLGLLKETYEKLWDNLLGYLNKKKFICSCLFSFYTILSARKVEIEGTLNIDKIEKPFELCLTSLKKRNKKVIIHAVKVLGAILEFSSLNHLERLFQESGENPDKQEKRESILLECVSVYINHKFPKYSWNMVYMIHQILSRSREEQRKKNLEQEQNGDNGEDKMELIESMGNNNIISRLSEQISEKYSSNLLDLFISSPNAKLKNQIAQVLLFKPINRTLNDVQNLTLLKFNHKLISREWEMKEMPKYAEVKALDELKDCALMITCRAIIKLFKDGVAVLDKLEESENKTETVKKILTFMNPFLAKLKSLLVTQGVKFGEEDPELAKLTAFKTIEFEMINGSEVQALVQSLSIMRVLVETDDDIEFSLLELDKLIAIDGRELLEGSKAQVGEGRVWVMKNIYAVEALEMDGVSNGEKNTQPNLSFEVPDELTKNKEEPEIINSDDK